MRRAPGLAKVVGTMVTVTGAMVMTLYKGPILEMVWSRGTNHGAPKSTDLVKKDWVRGSLMITFGSFCWSCFIILQVSYLYSQTQSFKWIGSYLRPNKRKNSKESLGQIHTHTHTQAPIQVCKPRPYNAQLLLFYDIYRSHTQFDTICVVGLRPDFDQDTDPLKTI